MDPLPPVTDAPAASVLVTVTGPDGPGIASALCGRLAECGVEVLDVEQIRVHGHLLLSVEVAGDGAAPARLRAALGRPGALGPGDATLRTTVAPLAAPAPGPAPGGGPPPDAHLVTVLAPRLEAATLSGLFARVSAAGANIERIVRLSDYPVVSYELSVAGGDPGRLREGLAAEAAHLGVDVAVQRAGLHRRGRHLIVLDVDSTLVQGEVIDLLAARTDHAEEVARITAAAMAGELDFAEALRRRVALLAGLPAGVLGEVRRELVPTPGARTLVRTLRRLGYVTAAVSGGFSAVTEPMAADLGIDHVAANVLEIAGGHLTGRLVGPLVDRPGKAAALRRFAALAGVAMAQTIAVGDGANDLDMLSAAGLGIAFNAKPVVRDAADTALSVPYLDAILFMLGISRQEIEAADREDDIDVRRPALS